MLIGSIVNVLYLSFEHPQHSGGGLATYLDQTIQATHEAGLVCTVLVVDTKLTAGQTRTSIVPGATIISWNPADQEVFSTMGYWPAISYAFSEKIKELLSNGNKFDWIESCDGHALAYFTLHRKLAGEQPFSDLKVCVTLHTPISLLDKWSHAPSYQIPNYWVGEMEKFCVKSADKLISPSQFLLDQLPIDWEIAEAPATVVRNPYKSGGNQRITHGASPDAERRYLVASRVHHFKGIPEVILGFEQYWKNGGKSKLLIAGGDTFSHLHGESLTSFLKTRYASRITEGLLEFKGLVNRDDLQSLRKQVNALIHPSLKENFPYTVVEHMAAGGVVAASRTGGQAEIIEHKKNGLLFDIHNPQEVAKAVAALDEMNAAELSAMGESAASTIQKHCDPSRVLKAKFDVLKSPIHDRTEYPFIRGRSKRMEKAPDEISGLLSVVIPYFNLPDFLPETVHSALASTNVNLEVIIVDDGSTDPRAKAVAAQLATIDPRVKLITKPNSGVADTRNHGVKAAKGEYVALLDADDVVSADYYEQALRVLERYSNVGFVGCWNEDFNEDGRIRIWPTFNPEPPAQFIFNTTNCQGIVVRRQAFLAHGQHDPELKMFLDDWECTINLLANDIRGVMLAHPLFHYRIRGGSIFRSRQGLWHTNYEKILKKHAHLASEFAVEALLFMNQNGPNTCYHNPTFISDFRRERTSKYKSPVRQALSDLGRAIKKTYRNHNH